MSLTGAMFSPNVPAPADPTAAPASLRAAAARVAAPYLITRLLVVLVGYLSTRVIVPGPWPADDASLLQLFCHWDSNWYLRIVSDGYQFFPGRESSVAFFPLYPLLIKVLSVAMDPRLAGYLISNAALFLAVTYLYRLVALDHADRDIADRTVWYLLISPVSFYFSSIYTESLFLCLVVMAFYHARRRRWLPAAICAMLAAATRSLGVLLVIPLLVEYLDLRRGNLRGCWRRLRPDVLLLGLVPLGLFGYMAFLQIRFADPFAFSKASAAWAREFVFFTETMWRARGLDPFYKVLFFGAVVMAVLAFWGAARRGLRTSYLVYLGLFAYFALSSNVMDSMPRYFSVLFPIYIGFVYIAYGSPVRDRIVTAGSLVTLSLTTVLFTNGYWMI